MSYEVPKKLQQQLGKFNEKKNDIFNLINRTNTVKYFFLKLEIC